jgi:hypothetical protein
MKRIAGILILTIFLAAAAGAANAQNQHFTTSGVIEFDKTINIYALIKKEMWDDKDGSMNSRPSTFIKKPIRSSGC